METASGGCGWWVTEVVCRVGGLARGAVRPSEGGVGGGWGADGARWQSVNRDPLLTFSRLLSVGTKLGTIAEATVEAALEADFLVSGALSDVVLVLVVDADADAAAAAAVDATDLTFFVALSSAALCFDSTCSRMGRRPVSRTNEVSFMLVGVGLKSVPTLVLLYIIL